MATYDHQNDGYGVYTHGYEDQTHGHDPRDHGFYDDGYQEDADGKYDDQGYPVRDYYQYSLHQENDDYDLDGEEAYHEEYDLVDPEDSFDQVGDESDPEHRDYSGTNEPDEEDADHHTDNEHPEAGAAAATPVPQHPAEHTDYEHPKIAVHSHSLPAQAPETKLSDSHNPHSNSAPRTPPPASHTDHPQESQDHQSVEHSKPGGPTLNIALRDTFKTDDKIYAYVIGEAIDEGSKLLLLSSDGKTPFYPTAAGPLHENIAIELHKDQPTVVTIPHIAGGRIYFSKNDQLEFSISNSISLVEPSVTNASDPNYLKEWGFMELTFNKDEVYSNISNVDFVGTIPLGLSLDTELNGTQHVSGMTTEGIEHVCQGLMQQYAVDGHDWDKLIVNDHNGKHLRVLSLNQAVIANPHLFPGYYDQYIDEVWSHLSSNPIHVDTQAAAGVVTGQVHGDKLTLGSVQLSKPDTIDVLTCNSGPFATGPDAATNAIIPRIAAAFNRSTFMTTDTFPEDHDMFYKEHVTNHYARVVHEANVDGKGYAFPYDDVQKTGGPDQSGEVHAGSDEATLLTVYVGGGMAEESKG